MQQNKIRKIIPCMDIRNGRVVKGINFTGIQDIADPVEMATYYNTQGADMVVFYDIGATVDNRHIFTDLLTRVRSSVSIPLMVGGGIATMNDVDRAFEYGADQISINSGALKDPNIIKLAADKYGSSKVVLSMDVSCVDGKYTLFSKAGTFNTGVEAVSWAKLAQENGAGQIVVNSIDTDGVKNGYDIAMLTAVGQAVDIPLVASGGAGKMEDFLEVFALPFVGTGLAASIFHSKQVNIATLKKYLSDNGVAVSQ